MYIYIVISVGLSDFHKMIVTVLKTTIVKGESKQIIYRDFKNYDDRMFQDDLVSNTNADAENKINFKNFQATFLDVGESGAR